MLTDEEIIESERELVYFGFNSIEVYQDFKEYTALTIRQILEDLQNLLIQKGNNRELVKRQIQNLYNLYIEKCKDPLKKLKEQYQLLTAIPRERIVPLVDDAEPVSEQEIKNLQNDIAQLEIKLVQEKVFHMELQHCQKQIDQVQDFINETEVLLSQDNEAQNYLKEIQQTLFAIQNLNQGTKKDSKNLHMFHGFYEGDDFS